MLIRLAYTSQLRPSPDKEAQIADIVADEGVRNKANEITGVIAFEGDRLCQTLEGESPQSTSWFGQSLGSTTFQLHGAGPSRGSQPIFQGQEHVAAQAGRHDDDGIPRRIGVDTLQPLCPMEPTRLQDV